LQVLKLVDKAKPGVSRGRKPPGLRFCETAGLPEKRVLGKFGFLTLKQAK